MINSKNRMTKNQLTGRVFPTGYGLDRDFWIKYNKMWNGWKVGNWRKVTVSGLIEKGCN
jgi:hypothetical protein